jgi:hypothetical protein
MSENFTEKTLKRIRSDPNSNGSKNRKNFSRIILFVDALILVILIIYFTSGENKKPDEFQTSVINYQGYTIRSSTGIIDETDNYYFSISLKSRDNKKKILLFNNFVGSLKIYHKKRLILEKVIGNNIKDITILPDEVKFFTTEVGREKFDNYLLKNTKKKTIRKTLFQFGKNSYKLNAIIKLNIDKGISSTLEFTHEVKE